ncbi:MAG: DUF3006 domain-containing protein [Faecalibacterium sp.]|nr:DUF3006 domain-containing protein [Ruminococcus sp.]MCM1391655.1 DUF3006 domain-containing protein [Ruminococcus sp.]MCM1486220.1 DUF3006 domain-containing protein [Faecalibacterium sp.]
MKLIVDRIEANIAVCEKDDLTRVEIPLSLLPSETHEGSVILTDEKGNYTLDISNEEQRRQRILEMQKRLFKKNN